MAPLQEAEPLHDRQLLRSGVRRSFLEPAQRARAGAAENDAAIPGLPQNDVDPLRLPDRLLIERIPARRDDAVHGKQYLVEALHLPIARNEALLDERDRKSVV